MSGETSEAPDIETMREAYEELGDVAIVAQELQHRFDQNGRPYLSFRARQLEQETHVLLDVLELLCCGWELTNHANR